MKFHSDQSLDLVSDSYICLFSCYCDCNSENIRKLQISEILLENNSIVLFSTSTNNTHLHKIILDSCETNNQWLGITFRLSKTFITFINELPFFHKTSKILTLANINEKNNFFKYKHLENINTEYCYPEIYYTISISDLLQIK